MEDLRRKYSILLLTITADANELARYRLSFIELFQSKVLHAHRARLLEHYSKFVEIDRNFAGLFQQHITPTEMHFRNSELGITAISRSATAEALASYQSAITEHEGTGRHYQTITIAAIAIFVSVVGIVASAAWSCA